MGRRVSVAREAIRRRGAQDGRRGTCRWDDTGAAGQVTSSTTTTTTTMPAVGGAGGFSPFNSSRSISSSSTISSIRRLRVHPPPPHNNHHHVSPPHPHHYPPSPSQLQQPRSMNEGVSFERIDWRTTCVARSVGCEGRLDLLQPIFYSPTQDARDTFVQGERAMLRRLEPEAPDRQLDRVEAMVSAAEQFATKATAVPVGSSGGFALHGVTLDAFVRAVHGGATAAARLATPEGGAAAAQLVGHLESAVMASPDVFHRALSSVVARGNLPARRRVMLHRAMLQIVPRALMPQMVARGGRRRAVLIASGQSRGCARRHGTGRRAGFDANMLPARLRSLRTELIQASALMSSSSYPLSGISSTPVEGYLILNPTLRRHRRRAPHHGGGEGRAGARRGVSSLPSAGTTGHGRRRAGHGAADPRAGSRRGEKTSRRRSGRRG